MTVSLKPLPASPAGQSAANARLLADAREIADWLEAFSGVGAALEGAAGMARQPLTRTVLLDAAAKLQSIEASLGGALATLRWRMKEIRFEAAGVAAVRPPCPLAGAPLDGEAQREDA